MKMERKNKKLSDTEKEIIKVKVSWIKQERAFSVRVMILVIGIIIGGLGYILNQTHN